MHEFTILYMNCTRNALVIHNLTMILLFGCCIILFGMALSPSNTYYKPGCMGEKLKKYNLVTFKPIVGV